MGFVLVTGIWPRTTDSRAEQRFPSHSSVSCRLPGRPGIPCAFVPPKGWKGGDFVLTLSGRAFMVLEVKGGQMEMRDGRWYQNGESMEHAREQALGYAKKLLVRLKELGCPSVLFGVLTLSRCRFFRRSRPG